jgi:hypothetical protein
MHLAKFRPPCPAQQAHSDNIPKTTAVRGAEEIISARVSRAGRNRSRETGSVNANPRVDWVRQPFRHCSDPQPGVSIIYITTYPLAKIAPKPDSGEELHANDSQTAYHDTLTIHLFLFLYHLLTFFFLLHPSSA